jgi:hypothetical protein
VSEAGGTTKIQVARQVDQELPGFAKKLFKPTNAFIGETALESLRAQHDHYARVLG